MTEGQKEQIKHKANFYNGVALIWLAGFAFSAAVRYRNQRPIPEELHDQIWYVFNLGLLVAIGCFGAFFIHRIGQAALRELDAKPPPPPSSGTPDPPGD